MTQDLNPSDLEADTICNLALEACANAVNNQFKNIDLVTRALAYFIEALEIKPNNYKIHLGLGILLLGGKLYDEAIGFLQNAYDLKPLEEIKIYLEIAEEELRKQKNIKIENIIEKKKTTVDDILHMSNKFKIK